MRQPCLCAVIDYGQQPIRTGMDRFCCKITFGRRFDQWSTKGRRFWGRTTDKIANAKQSFCGRYYFAGWRILKLKSDVELVRSSDHCLPPVAKIETKLFIECGWNCPLILSARLSLLKLTSFSQFPPRTERKNFKRSLRVKDNQPKGRKKRKKPAKRRRRLKEGAIGRSVSFDNLSIPFPCHTRIYCQRVLFHCYRSDNTPIEIKFWQLLQRRATASAPKSVHNRVGGPGGYCASKCAIAAPHTLRFVTLKGN